MPPPQVVVVGAGVTGSLLAFFLRDSGLPVRVLEKSRRAGGRMVTHQHRHGGQEGPVAGRADLGAQYITTRSTPDHAVFGPIYKSLRDSGALIPFEGQVEGPNPYGGAGAEVRHFVAPHGFQSVVEHFLEESGAEVQWSSAAAGLSLAPDGGAVLEASAGEAAKAEVVVLTQPVPQVLGHSKFPMAGNFLRHLSPDALAALKQVAYSSRFAAAFFFSASELAWPYPWTVRYFDEGDVRYVAHDTGKRGAWEEPDVAVLVHSGVPLGFELLEELEPFARVEARFRLDLEGKLPDIPWAKATAVKMHKWRYGQVYKAVGDRRPSPDWVWSLNGADSDFPGCLELCRGDRALALLAGDALAPAGNFEGCVFSAHKTAAAVKAFADGYGAELPPHSDL